MEGRQHARAPCGGRARGQPDKTVLCCLVQLCCRSDCCPACGLLSFPHTVEPALVLPLPRRAQDDGLQGIGKAISPDVSTPFIAKTPLAHTTLGEKLM
jgi:hypothetical protein